MIHKKCVAVVVISSTTTTAHSPWERAVSVALGYPQSGRRRWLTCPGRETLVSRTWLVFHEQPTQHTLSITFLAAVKTRQKKKRPLTINRVYFQQT